MRKCRYCNQLKRFDEFEKNKSCRLGITYMCKKCKSVNNAKWRTPEKSKRYYESIKNLVKYKAIHSKASRKYILDNPDKSKAHSKAKYKYGTLFGNCTICGILTKLEKHHPDYSKPLQIIPLCPSCHRGIHKLERGTQLLQEVK